MSGRPRLYLVRPGPRPPYYRVADHVWPGANIDSDGNSAEPRDTNWTELWISSRAEDNQHVAVDLASRDPLVLEVSASSDELLERAITFLAEQTGGLIATHWKRT